ncbi:nuclease-related domain-containing protein [Salipaludibacillus daqingensis]|uniref:nuclease-related domain-containing protein n=1 Tax=Salipaludibacillus daqingensis TaxID=3041001 RepID=UPI00247398ED|nr:nuclease-related domain-containing protein [Salipaludibacillus daqingensis]
MLKPRMLFSEEHTLQYENMEKGYEGEVIFDSWLKNITFDSIILNDLLLKVNQSEFQIDSLLIYSKGIIIFEVKNYRGDFYIDQNGKWFTISNKDIQNPILQVQRAETLFKQLLRQYRSPHFQLKPFVIFTNQEFTLFQTPLNLPLILPNQINHFMYKLNNTSTSNLTQQYYDLANKLLASHIEKSPYSRLPKYEFDHLDKGVVCPQCQSFMSAQQHKFTCDSCGFIEPKSIGIIRSINEFQLLFPDKKIKSKDIYDWIGHVAGRKTIRQLLIKNCNRVGYGAGTFFVYEGTL